MIKFEITKWQVCDECDGSGKKQGESGATTNCENCEGNGATYIGEGTPDELVEYWHSKLPDEDRVVYTEERLNDIREMFEAARNKQKES